MDATRREFVARGAGLAAAGAVAGCLDDVALGSGGEPVGYASFFTLADVARQVGGDAFGIENPVPAGALGHQWDEPQGLREDVLLSDAFVYLDVEGFQSWAIDTARTVEREGSDAVVIDAAADVDLLEYDEHGDERAGDDGHGDGDDHDDHEDDDAHGGDHDDHDETGGHGEYDPHYWTDPLRVRDSVEAIAAGLAEADPANEDVYEENAAAYADRLEDLHERFADGLADRDRDVAVVASHDSYGYLADRYGFDVHSTHGIHPQAEPSSHEIADTVDLVDEEGIETILYDRFESPNGETPRAAAVIVEESSATEALPITSAEGTTEEWNEEGYGYVEQLREINLPAFRRALGAEP